MLDKRQIDGISYLCGGQTGGKPLVLLHGIGSNAQSFLPLMEQLASARPLLAWDAPGYAASRPLAISWPSATDYATRLADVLDREGVESCDLLGHSLGAIVAGRFAALYPERVSRLILASPALGYRVATFSSRIEFTNGAEVSKHSVSLPRGPAPPRDNFS